MSIVIRLLESTGLMLTRLDMGLLLSSLGRLSPTESREESNIPKHAITLIWASAIQLCAEKQRLNIWQRARICYLARYLCI